MAATLILSSQHEHLSTMNERIQVFMNEISAFVCEQSYYCRVVPEKIIYEILFIRSSITTI